MPPPTPLSESLQRQYRGLECNHVPTTDQEFAPGAGNAKPGGKLIPLGPMVIPGGKPSTTGSSFAATLSVRSSRLVSRLSRLSRWRCLQRPPPAPTAPPTPPLPPTAPCPPCPPCGPCPPCPPCPTSSSRRLDFGPWLPPLSVCIRRLIALDETPAPISISGSSTHIPVTMGLPPLPPYGAVSIHFLSASVSL